MTEHLNHPDGSNRLLRKEPTMKKRITIIIAALAASLTLTACPGWPTIPSIPDRPPTTDRPPDTTTTTPDRVTTVPDRPDDPWSETSVPGRDPTTTLRTDS